MNVPSLLNRKRIMPTRARWRSLVGTFVPGTRKQTLAGIALLAAAYLLTAPDARADVIYQTANLGPTGQLGGLSIDAGQYIGVRFQTLQDFTLTSVQVHIAGVNTGNNLIFAAIVPLSDMNDLPNAGDPNLIADDNPLEVHVFEPTFQSSAVSTIAFSSVLPAGTYGLVFGSGEFGATGEGRLATSNTDIGSPAYFFKLGGGFLNGGSSNEYLVVNGTPFTSNASAPEPATFALLALGVPVLGIGIPIVRRRD